MQIRLVHSDCFLKLLDVLSPTLPKGSLGLAVPLLAFLGSSIDL